MKKEEAKKKWCPYAKGQYPRQTHCKASECMMWNNWEYEKLGEEINGETPVIVINEGEGDCGLKPVSTECGYDR